MNVQIAQTRNSSLSTYRTKLQDHTEFIGLHYAMDAIDANSLTFSIKDVLVRMHLPLSNCRGQCYDGASNMSGAKMELQNNFQILRNETLLLP